MAKKVKFRTPSKVHFELHQKFTNYMSKWSSSFEFWRKVSFKIIAGHQRSKKRPWSTNHHEQSERFKGSRSINHHEWSERLMRPWSTNHLEEARGLRDHGPSITSSKARGLRDHGPSINSNEARGSRRLG